jgi:LytS/YehU family sensor histidine kinase
MEINTFLQGIELLFGDAAVIGFVILLIFSLKRFKKMLNANSSPSDKIMAGFVFGLLAIYGTLSAKQVEGALLNVRDLAPMVAGILGGPIVGLIAGLVGGIQRFSIGGFTAVPCSLATVLAGTIAGLLSDRLKGKHFILKVLVLSACLEIIHMGLILLIAQPTENAIVTVGKIAAPMVVANSVGAACIVYLSNRMK